MKKGWLTCIILCAVLICAFPAHAEAPGCAACGNPLEADMAFCPFCGTESPGEHPEKTDGTGGTVTRAGVPSFTPVTAQALADSRNQSVSNNRIHWRPKDGQPLNAYMVITNNSSQLVDGKITGVTETEELAPELAGELRERARTIEKRSGGAIRFVDDPDQAEIVVFVRHDYEYFGKYTNEAGRIITGYTCDLSFHAELLANSRYNILISRENEPGEVAVYHGDPNAEVFCMPVPELEDTPELDKLVDCILLWYGYNPDGNQNQGMFIPALESIRLKLYERGYLAEPGETLYDEALKDAVRQLQRDYGLAPTGGLDSATLQAVWYDRPSLEPGRELYMADMLRRNAEMRGYCGKCGYVWDRDGWTHCPRCGEELKDSVPGENGAETTGVSAGDVVVFGRWKQGGSKKNSTESIEWIVLEVEDGKALLLSLYALDMQPYNKQDKEITWEKSSVRTWLNGQFWKSAFSKEEKQAVAASLLPNGPEQSDPRYRTDGGKETEDNVFLLSYAEAMKYLDGSHGRICAATPVTAAKKDVTLWDDYRVNGRSSCNWYLRTPLDDLTRVSYVTCSGTISGNSAALKGVCIRPAVRVDAEILAQMQPAE